MRIFRPPAGVLDVARLISVRSRCSAIPPASLGARAERRSDERSVAAARESARGASRSAASWSCCEKTANGLDPLFTRRRRRARSRPAAETVFLGLLDGAGALRRSRSIPASAEALKARATPSSPTCARSRCRVWSRRTICRRSPKRKALLAWHARHRFCANCGAPTDLVEAGWRRDCPACKVEHFPRTDPVVIMLAIAGERCLLGRPDRFVANMWSCLAGFVEPGETIRGRGAARDAGGSRHHLRAGELLRARSPGRFPMSLMIGCHAAGARREIIVDRDELEDARWFDREEVALMLLRQHPDGLPRRRRSRSPSHHPRLGRGGRRCLRANAGRSTSLLCAGIAVLERCFRVESFPRAGRQDAGERILRRQRRLRGQRGGRDRASRRARALRRPARRPGRR